MIWDVVVVGAGLAGLVCARRLQAVGYQVLVLEKSRGLGGRLATRRVQNQAVDHGCRFLEPTGLPLTQLIRQLSAEGVLEIWCPACYDVTTAGTLQERPPGDWWAAPAGMTAVAKRLAEGLEIWRQTKVVDLRPKTHWQVTLEASDSDKTPLLGRAVVLAVPAPQALEILRSATAAKAGFDVELLAGLQSVTFEASITLFAGYETLPQQNLSQGHQGWMVFGGPTTAFAWAGLDSGKRGTSQHPVVVVQSCDRFAQPYLNESDLGEAGAQLLMQAAQSLGPDLATPLWTQVHRWRYAIPKTPLSQSKLVTQHPLPLVCGGDWGGGTDAGTALTSGWDMAAAIHQVLGGSEEMAQLPESLL